MSKIKLNNSAIDYQYHAVTLNINLKRTYPHIWSKMTVHELKVV